jgi:hypothetical protein
MQLYSLGMLPDWLHLFPFGLYEAPSPCSPRDKMWWDSDLIDYWISGVGNELATTKGWLFTLFDLPGASYSDLL